MAVEIESFFGVYLLITVNPKYKGRTYIGFTVDPRRRIKQHNRGKEFGGANRTSSRGPWEMLLIVHGFPNQISALRFEWAWQHPKSSRRLKHVPPKKSSERMFDFNFRLLGEMLHCPPWKRLPLTVRWLRPEVKFKEFAKRPPEHMKVVRGDVKAVKVKKKKNQGQSEDNDELICSVCFKNVDKIERVRCLSDKCGAISHVICLAQKFLNNEEGHLVPVEGFCPVCEVKSLWGEMVKRRSLRLQQDDIQSSQKSQSDDDNDDEDDDQVLTQQPNIFTQTSKTKRAKKSDNNLQNLMSEVEIIPSKSQEQDQKEEEEEEMDEFDMMVDF